MQRFLAGLNEQELAAWGGSRACHPKAAIEVFFACTRYVTLTGWDAAGGGGGDITGLMLEVFEAAEKQLGAARRGRAPKGKGGTGGGWWAPIEDVISALAGTPNDHVSWDYWNNVCMAVWNATGQSGEGLLAFCGWSAKCEFKHVEAHCADNWERLWRSPPNNIGFGWLAKEAKKANKDWRRPSRSPEAEFEKEEEPGDAQPGEGAAPFRALLDRVAYIIGVDRWFDLEERRIMKMEGLMHVAARMGVVGHSEQGKKSIAARLRGHRNPQMQELVGLACMPGQGPLVEKIDAEGRRGWLGNLWIRGGVTPSDGDAGMWLDLARRLIPDEADRERTIDWMAYALQNPGRKINHALVLVGPQGAGKDTLLQAFWSAVGEHNMVVVQGAKVVDDKFTGYLRHPFVLITEMPPARKRSCYEEIKSWLTVPPDRLAVNEKMIASYMIPNIVNVVVTTNHVGAIALADDDRRFDIIQTQHAVRRIAADELTPDERDMDEHFPTLWLHLTEEEQAEALRRDAFIRSEQSRYFTAFYAWLAAGGGAAVAGYLLRRDVSAFDPAAAPPDTLAKVNMMREGAHPTVSWVTHMVTDGVLAGRDLVPVDEIMDLITRHNSGSLMVWNSVSLEAIARALRLDGWAFVKRVRFGNGRIRLWARRGAKLLRQLPASALIVRLEADRKRVHGSEF
jgi:hypothetical protein